MEKTPLTLSEYLPNEEADDDKKEEKAFSDFRPLSFEIQSVKTGRHRRQADISMKKNGGAKHKEKEKKKEKEKDKDKEKKRRNNKHGTGTGKVSEVFLSRKRTPYDAIAGEYQISFISEETVSDLMVGLRIGSDDDNMSRAEIQTATINGKTLAIKNGLVSAGPVSKGEKKTIRVKLTESGERALEVRAYAER